MTAGGSHARARHRLAVTGGVVAVLLGALAACTSGGGSTPSSAAPSSVSAPATSSSPTTSSPTDSPSPTDPSSTAPGSTAPPASTGPPSSAPPTSTLPTCADLDVAVTRVPGAAGVTFGLVTVTSRGAARCQLPGVPSLRLLGPDRSPVTEVAKAVGGSQAATALDPGGVASTLLEDRSDQCQADTRSSFVEVKATPAAATVVAALALPPCSLSVKPFTPGTQPSP